MKRLILSALVCFLLIAAFSPPASAGIRVSKVRWGYYHLPDLENNQVLKMRATSGNEYYPLWFWANTDVVDSRIWGARGTYSTVRVYVDNAEVYKEERFFVPQYGSDYYGAAPINLPAGPHEVRVEFYRGWYDAWGISIYYNSEPDNVFTFTAYAAVPGFSVSQSPVAVTAGGGSENLAVTVTNTGNDTAYGAMLSVKSSDNLILEPSEVGLGDIGQGENADARFEVRAPVGSTPKTASVKFSLKFWDNGSLTAYQNEMAELGTITIKPNYWEDSFGNSYKLPPSTSMSTKTVSVAVQVSGAEGAGEVGPPLTFSFGPWFPWWLLLLYFLISAILAAWVYRDSRGRRMRRRSWAGLVFLTSVVGLAAYLKRRKPRRARARIRRAALAKS